MIPVPSRAISRFPLTKAAILIALAAISLLLVRNVDFRVYWYAVTGFFDGTRPAYGPLSGIGAPMDYVYPPVTYLLLYPIRLLPLRTAGLLWMFGEFFCVAVSVFVCARIWHLRFRPAAIVACSALMLPYLVLSARYGNVQPFVIAFVFIALVLTKEKPWLSGLLFALAVSFKVTPLFFLPWFFKRWKSLYFFCLFTFGLWLAPFVFLGVSGYFGMLRGWYAAASNIGGVPSEFHYFPGQTLRALCLRFLTPIPPLIGGYPRVSLFSLPPSAAVKVWQVLAAGIYALVISGMFRVRYRAAFLWDGLAFVLYSVLQPFAVKVSLISLGPAAVIGAAFFTTRAVNSSDTRNRWANRLYLAAALLSFGAACVQYKPYLRLLQAIGIDFWVASLLGGSLLLWIVGEPGATEEHPNIQEVTHAPAS